MKARASNGSCTGAAVVDTDVGYLPCAQREGAIEADLLPLATDGACTAIGSGAGTVMWDISHALMES